jgi:kynurenine formamidase
LSRKFIDISVALEMGIRSDPPPMEPQITYLAHDQTADQIIGCFPGLERHQLPGGERALTIDGVPLEWCFNPGVKLDFRHMEDGYLATAADIDAELRRIGHDLRRRHI